MKKKKTWTDVQKQLYNMVSIGVVDNKINQGYDIISTVMLFVNIIVSFAMTYDSAVAKCGTVLYWAEAVTVFFFAVDYVLRVITAEQLYPGSGRGEAIIRYATSGFGIIDLLSFLPYYLPAFFPAGAVVFRMFRVIRIFRLFRINAYSDSLTLIGNVISSKKTQILASMFIIMILILASSLCMYSVEHNAQPDVFENAFSAIWWATSTLLTVGYGDIYPVTVLGQILGIIITFLGVGLVAIPTGIISAGFVEEYQKATRLADIERNKDIHFIEITMRPEDHWVGEKIKNLGLPHGSIIAIIVRDKDTLTPRGDVVIQEGDKLIMCAESADDGMLEEVREVTLGKNHLWNDTKIRELDISRQTFIILVDRGGNMIIPYGDLKLREGDKVLLYSKENLKKYERGVSY